MPKALHFSYAESKDFCEKLGLKWLGDEWVRNADDEAWLEGFSQKQVDVAMKHHLIQIKCLFSPNLYRWRDRALMAFYFISGWAPGRE